eukprot:759513-Hanusia_phi.AAC.8
MCTGAETCTARATCDRRPVMPVQVPPQVQEIPRYMLPPQLLGLNTDNSQHLLSAQPGHSSELAYLLPSPVVQRLFADERWEHRDVVLQDEEDTLLAPTVLQNLPGPAPGQMVGGKARHLLVADLPSVVRDEIHHVGRVLPQADPSFLQPFELQRVHPPSLPPPEREAMMHKYPVQGGADSFAIHCVKKNSLRSGVLARDRLL